MFATTPGIWHVETWRGVEFADGTVRFVLVEKLLRAADRAARRTRLNRSALVREALRAYVLPLEVQRSEERDRKSYEVQPQDESEWLPWVAEAVWPPE